MPDERMPDENGSGDGQWRCYIRENGSGDATSFLGCYEFPPIPSSSSFMTSELLEVRDQYDSREWQWRCYIRENGSGDATFARMAVEMLHSRESLQARVS